MTLRRKNLVSHWAGVSIYGLLIVTAMVVTMYEYMRYGICTFRTVAFIGNVGVLFRLNPYLPKLLTNKYLIWIGLYFLTNTYLRPYAFEALSQQRNMVFTVSLVAVFIQGYIKVHHSDPTVSTNGTKKLD
jgi:hypothetical protein